MVKGAAYAGLPAGRRLGEAGMLVGEIRGQIDSIWNDFWSGGVANPLSVIEQITYLLFIKRLDELQSVDEARAVQLKQPLERRVFPEGADPRGEPYENLRWKNIKGQEPREMFRIVEEHVFPFIRERVAAGGSLAKSMRDARFQIPTPALLAKVVDKLDHVPMGDRDTKGDVYEYMLGKIASAGQNGQFRTPRHIIALMTALMAPTPKDVICDPGLRHLRLPGGRKRIPARPSPRPVPRRRSAPPLQQRSLPRLRLRPDHAAHRGHEHDPARG